MDRWRERTALVTGASSGIGLATAEALAKLGMNVVGCARNLEKINELQNILPKGAGSVHAIQCDITKEGEIKRMFEEIEKTYKHVDILVNNAGMAKPDTLAEGTVDGWRAMIDVNVMGLSICAREALRLMAKDKVEDGHIININSMAGHSVPPWATAHFYSATKHMVIALTEALYREVKEISPKIRVTSISPGGVATEFGKRWIGEENVKKMDLSKMNFPLLHSQDWRMLLFMSSVRRPMSVSRSSSLRPRNNRPCSCY